MMKSKLSISKGTALPLGVTNRDGRINMSIIAPNCNSCKIHFFDNIEKENILTVDIPSECRIGDICCITIEGLDTTQYDYVYEIDNKIVIDPYAKVIVGKEKWGKFNQYTDPYSVRCGFVNQEFDWKEDKTLELPYSEMILYKMHVRGFTKHYSSSCGKMAGTYRGVIEKIPYLKELGITAVLLMPIVEFNEILIEDSMLHTMEANTQNKKLEFINIAKKENEYQDMVISDTNAENTVDKNKKVKNPSNIKDTKQIVPYRVNYWGYSKQNSYFAPKAAYAYNQADVMSEVKTMIYELHKARIEVIMEFNFTEDMTQQMILDCLRYWHLEYHIDGFSINDNVVITQVLAQDPVLARAKFLATTWNHVRRNERRDSYRQDGSIRRNLAEYNDGFLVDVRRFLKGDEEQVSPFSSRMKRNPSEYAVINYITNNNGFTLHDLVSYDVKHNELNGEDNKDGTDYNYSWNCGVEGKTAKKKILKLRKQQIKNALVMLLLSQGTPMLMMGDEFGNSQEGNNNAYCQDNLTSWLNWANQKKNMDTLHFVQMLINFRKTSGVYEKDEEYRMLDYISCGCPDLSYHGTKAWYPDFSNYSRVFGVMYCGAYIKDVYYYIAFNMHWEEHEFDLPRIPSKQEWKVCFCTAEEENILVQKEVDKADTKENIISKHASTNLENCEGKVINNCLVPPRSILVLCSHIKKK